MEGMNTLLASTKPLVFITTETEGVSIKENYCTKGINIITDSYMSGYYITSYLRKELAKNFTFGYHHSKLVQMQKEWIAMKYMRNSNCLLGDGSSGIKRKSIALEQIQNLFVVIAGSYGVAIFLVVLELFFNFCLGDSLIVSVLYAAYFRMSR